jgi:hypothetical protein
MSRLKGLSANIAVNKRECFRLTDIWATLYAFGSHKMLESTSLADRISASLHLGLDFHTPNFVLFYRHPYIPNFVLFYRHPNTKIHVVLSASIYTKLHVLLSASIYTELRIVLSATICTASRVVLSASL